MKRMIKAILLFDFMAGLLFLSIKGLQDTAVAADSGIVRIEGDKDLEMEEVKKIAITLHGPAPGRAEGEGDSGHVFCDGGACGITSGYYRKNV